MKDMVFTDRVPSFPILVCVVHIKSASVDELGLLDAELFVGVD